MINSAIMLSSFDKSVVSIAEGGSLIQSNRECSLNGKRGDDTIADGRKCKKGHSLSRAAHKARRYNAHERVIIANCKKKKKSIKQGRKS